MKGLISLFFIFMSDVLLACPTCMGSDPNSNDSRVVYILSGFILLTYIPFYFIYKTIIKNRDFNREELPSSERSN